MENLYTLYVKRRKCRFAEVFLFNIDTALRPIAGTAGQGTGASPYKVLQGNPIGLTVVWSSQFP